jgi:hypothetical protein
LLHLALAAFLAISFLRRGVNLFALALPPFNPPSLPNATAEGFFSGLGFSSDSIVLDTILVAIRFMSSLVFFIP